MWFFAVAGESVPGFRADGDVICVRRMMWSVVLGTVDLESGNGGERGSILNDRCFAYSSKDA